MKINSWIILVIAVAVVAGGWWLWRSKALPPRESNQVPLPGSELGSSEQVPDLAFQNYNGDTVRLRDFEMPLVVNAWAAWCPFCREELKDFAVVQKEFEGQMRIIAIDRAEPLEVAKAFTDELGVSEDVVLLLDPVDSFYTAIGGFAMPETIFVKSDGTIHFHKRGVMTQEEIRKRVEELIKSQ